MYNIPFILFMITNDLQLFEKLKKVLLYENSDDFLKTIKKKNRDCQVHLVIK